MKKICSVVPFLAKTFWNIIKFLWGIIRTKVFWIIFIAMLWSYGVYWFRSNYHLENPIQIKLKCLICYNEALKVKSPVVGQPVSKLVPPNAVVLTEREVIDGKSQAKILHKIYMLESTYGKNDKCREEGKYNGFGFGQNSEVWNCFDSFDEVATKVNAWFEDKFNKGFTEAEAICYYNLGIRQVSCKYFQTYITI